MMAARRGAPPLASIESLLSFEAKSTPRSEYGLSGLPGLPPGVELGGGLGRSDSVLPVESFQVLSGDQQTEEIFKLLSLLSPFAGEVSILSRACILYMKVLYPQVSGLKTSIDSALCRIRER